MDTPFIHDVPLSRVMVGVAMYLHQPQTFSLLLDANRDYPYKYCLLFSYLHDQNLTSLIFNATQHSTIVSRDTPGGMC